MFNPNEKVKAEALKCVLGESTIPQTVEGNEELVKVLTACGIAMPNKDKKVTVFKSRNMLSEDKTMFLTKEQVQTWKKLNFTMDFELRGRNRQRLNVVVDKLPGDNFATVADSNGNHIFGAIVAIQDSRSPWVLLPNDKRPFALQFTNKQMPNDNGVCYLCTGWTKKEISSNTSTYVYDGSFEVWSCTKIVRKVLSDHLGIKFEHKTSDLNNTQRAKFLRAEAGVYYRSLTDGRTIEITKENGDSVGKILVGETEVGSVTLNPTSKSYGIWTAEIAFNDETLSIDERVEIENSIWIMLTPRERVQNSPIVVGGKMPNVGVDITTASKSSKKGKKQFAMSK